MLQDELRNGYRKTYKMRSQGEGGLNIVVSIPRQIIAREARRKGMSILEFLKHYRAIATYNGFEGVLYTFEKVEVDG